MTPEERQQRADQVRRQLAAKLREQRASQMAASNQARYEASTGQPLPNRQEAIADADRIAERDLARSGMTRGEAVLHGYTSGGTLRWGDEILGAIGGPEVREGARAKMEQARTAYPGLTTAAELGGAVATGAALPGTRTIGGAAGMGGAMGAVDAAGGAEGSLQDRALPAAVGGGAGLFFGGLSSALFKGASNQMQKLFRAAETRPTLQNLRAVKNQAYDAVRKSGFKFSPDDMDALYQRALRRSKTSRWDVDPMADVDKPAMDALRVLERRQGQEVSLNSLDKIRQKLWDNYNRTDHPFVLQLIDELDETIARNAGSNELIKTARAANSRFAKAQLLANAFDKAERQTEAAGSGGNIFNKYRQAINRIVDKPSEAKFFSPEEIAIMKQFGMVDNKRGADFMRRVGKLSPGGNGLMTVIHAYGAMIDPTFLAAAGLGAGAKKMADDAAVRGTQNVLDMVATGRIPQPEIGPRLNVPASVGGVGVNFRDR